MEDKFGALKSPVSTKASHKIEDEREDDRKKDKIYNNFHINLKNLKNFNKHESSVDKLGSKSSLSLLRPSHGLTMNDTIDMTSMRESQILEDETFIELNHKLKAQRDAIKTQEDWLIMLLNIIESGKHNYFTKHIQMGLDATENLFDENSFLKQELSNQKKESEIIHRDIELLKFQIENAKNNGHKNKQIKTLLNEKHSLLNTVNVISEDIGKENDKEARLTKLKEEEIIESLSKELESLTNENESLKIKLQSNSYQDSQSKFKLSKRSKAKAKSSKSNIDIFSCLANTIENEASNTFIFSYKK